MGKTKRGSLLNQRLELGLVVCRLHKNLTVRQTKCMHASMHACVFNRASFIQSSSALSRSVDLSVTTGTNG